MKRTIACLHAVASLTWALWTMPTGQRIAHAPTLRFLRREYMRDLRWAVPADLREVRARLSR